MTVFVYSVRLMSLVTLQTSADRVCFARQAYASATASFSGSFAAQNNVLDEEDTRNCNDTNAVIVKVFPAPVGPLTTATQHPI